MHCLAAAELDAVSVTSESGGACCSSWASVRPMQALPRTRSQNSLWMVHSVADSLCLSCCLLDEVMWICSAALANAQPPADTPLISCLCPIVESTVNIHQGLLDALLCWIQNAALESPGAGLWPLPSSHRTSQRRGKCASPKPRYLAHDVCCWNSMCSVQLCSVRLLVVRPLFDVTRVISQNHRISLDPSNALLEVGLRLDKDLSRCLLQLFVSKCCLLSSASSESPTH